MEANTNPCHLTLVKEEIDLGYGDVISKPFILSTSSLKAENAKAKPQSSAERQRRYRERRKCNPEKEAAEKEKRKVLNSKRMKISELPKREQRRKRKEWKNAAQRYRDRTKGADNPESSVGGSSLQPRGRRAVFKNRPYRDKKQLEIENAKLKEALEESRRNLDKLRKRLKRLGKKKTGKEKRRTEKITRK